MLALWNDISRSPCEIRSVLSKSQLAARRDLVNHEEHQGVAGCLAGAVSRRAANSRPTVEDSQAEKQKWGLENNTTWYGQEKKLWANITVCLCFPSSQSICLSLTIEALIPFKRNKDVCIFVKRKCHSFIPYATMQLEKTGLFNLGAATSFGEGKLNSNLLSLA